MSPPPYSESEFQCALHDSWIGRAVNLSKKRAVHGRGWIAQPSVIENIECLNAKFEVRSFIDGEEPCKGRIQVPLSRAEQRAPAEISVTAGRRFRKRSRVKPRAHAWVADIRISH